MIDPGLILITAAAVVTCYFTACNYALLDFSRGRLIELMEQRGGADAVDRITDLRDDLLFVTAIVRALANIAILAGCVAVIAPPQEQHTWLELTLAAVTAAVIIVVFGVAIPISWSRYAAEPLLAVSMPILKLAGRIAHPIMVGLRVFDPIVRRLLGAPKQDDNGHGPAEQEILDAVSEGAKSGLVDEDQQDMIEAVVEFPSITVDQIMTPRTDIEALSIDATLDDVRRFIREQGHSRVPIYEGDVDHIVGILYLKDLVPLLGANGHKPFVMRDFVREAVFVPETKPLRELLSQFKTTKVHIAIVLDEYGGTAGLVTIEDIIEEIVGEIHDEHEPAGEPEPTVQRIDDRSFEADGRVYIDDLNDELPIELPDEEDYDTVGGFVFARLGHIPEAGESFDFETLRFTVIDAEKTRVNRVRIEVLTGDEQSVTEFTD